MAKKLKQELIELLETVVSPNELLCDGEVLVSTSRVANHLIANGVTIQKWIPVSERLPEECGFYICFYQSPYGNDCLRVGQCHWNEESWVRIGAIPPHVKVTHWMPLPEPPKGD